MSGFKDSVERDVLNVFLNTDDFADLHAVTYDGITRTIPVVLDNEIEKDRKAYRDDNAQGINIVTATLYAALSDFEGVLPEKDMRICIDDHEYYIVTSKCNMGQLALGLRRYDE